MSKHNDDVQHIWECSAADGCLTVQEDTEQMYGEVKRGTKVILHMKDDQLEFLKVGRLEHLCHTCQPYDVIYHNVVYGKQYNLYVENENFVAGRPMKKLKP